MPASRRSHKKANRRKSSTKKTSSQKNSTSLQKKIENCREKSEKLKNNVQKIKNALKHSQSTIAYLKGLVKLHSRPVKREVIKREKKTGRKRKNDRPTMINPKTGKRILIDGPTFKRENLVKPEEVTYNEPYINNNINNEPYINKINNHLTKIEIIENQQQNLRDNLEVLEKELEKAEDFINNGKKDDVNVENINKILIGMADILEKSEELRVETASNMHEMQNLQQEARENHVSEQVILENIMNKQQDEKKEIKEEYEIVEEIDYGVVGSVFSWIGKNVFGYNNQSEVNDRIEQIQEEIPKLEKEIETTKEVTQELKKGWLW